MPGVATDSEGCADVGSKAAGDEKESEAEAKQGDVWKLKQGEHSPPENRTKISIITTTCSRGTSFLTRILIIFIILL